MKCKKVRQFYSEYLQGALPVKLSAQVERHLKACSNCHKELQELRQTIELFKTIPQPPKPPADFKEQVLERLRQEEALFREKLIIPRWKLRPAVAVSFAATIIICLCVLYYYMHYPRTKTPIIAEAPRKPVEIQEEIAKAAKMPEEIQPEVLPEAAKKPATITAVKPKAPEKPTQKISPQFEIAKAPIIAPDTLKEPEEMPKKPLFAEEKFREEAAKVAAPTGLAGLAAGKGAPMPYFNLMPKLKLPALANRTTDLIIHLTSPVELPKANVSISPTTPGVQFMGNPPRAFAVMGKQEMRNILPQQLPKDKPVEIPMRFQAMFPGVMHFKINIEAEGLPASRYNLLVPVSPQDKPQAQLNYISTQFQRLQIQECLEELSKQSGYAFIYPEDLSGEVSCEFKEAPISEVLSTILSKLGFSFSRVGAVFQIFKPNL